MKRLFLASALVWMQCATPLLYAQPPSVNPTPSGLRAFGFDQCNAGSCGAEAQTGSLEFAFARHGYPVRLSKYYRHDWNWTPEGRARKDKDAATIQLPKDRSKATSDIMAHYGGILPDYFFPEDGEGLTFRDGLGIRPAIESFVKVFKDFPNANAFGFSDEHMSFTQGFSNTGDLRGLKIAVSNGHGVSLTVHPGIIGMMDERTGLPKEKYTKEAMLLAQKGFGPEYDKFTGTHNHAVAVLGYDDKMFGDQGYRIPGAIFVQNSWTSPQVQAETRLAGKEEAPKLEMFRKKYFQHNVAGVYAIPQAYLLDMIEFKAPNGETGIGGYRIMSIRYADYAAKYLAMKRRVKVLALPFACDTKRFFGDQAQMFSAQARRKLELVQKYQRILAQPGAGEAEQNRARDGIKRLVFAESGIRQAAAFQYAKIPVLDDDYGAVNAFYSGAFKDYYCANTPELISNEYVGKDGRKSGNIWPYHSEYKNNKAFAAAIETLSKNPRSPEGWLEVLEALASTDIATREEK